MYGGGVVLDLPWPDLPDWPNHSVTATRALFDATLARNAEKAGAQLWEGCEVVGPVWLSTSERRVAGVACRRAGGSPAVVRAPRVGGAPRGGGGVGRARGRGGGTPRPPPPPGARPAGGGV
jgi:menaquinone-9 beta-reductase